MNIELLKADIADYKKAIREKKAEIANFEIDPDSVIDQYRDMLDECYPELFGMNPSYILEKCDPIAFRCGLNDYIDGIELSSDANYMELEDELSELEDELSELEDELSELEDELSELENNQ